MVLFSPTNYFHGDYYHSPLMLNIQLVNWLCNFERFKVQTAKVSSLEVVKFAELSLHFYVVFMLFRVSDMLTSHIKVYVLCKISYLFAIAKNTISYKFKYTWACHLSRRTIYVNALGFDSRDHAILMHSKRTENSSTCTFCVVPFSMSLLFGVAAWKFGAGSKNRKIRRMFSENRDYVIHSKSFMCQVYTNYAMYMQSVQCNQTKTEFSMMSFWDIVRELVCDLAHCLDFYLNQVCFRNGK